ncbi:MAG: flagellar biosynthesis anti-sigma factor FlgM [Deltaproteobacteria bacterium]|jgi:negative regulator of flagellin synthesis FlgM|nr:flagellar biosynthesis anti-sigma factor FlgM [Deltaproteobacteria bacterium]
MKIDNLNPYLNQLNGKTKAGQIKIKGETSGTTEETRGNSVDTVSLSNRSRLIAKATELATLSPDIRSEKVAELTAKIASGNYKVSSQDVADSIIRKSLTGIV